MTDVKLIARGSDPANYEGTHVIFAMTGTSPTGKTVVWHVLAKAGGKLGVVKWFGRWRKYSFFPAPECIFEQLCLREIAQFIQDRTREHATGI